MPEPRAMGHLLGSRAQASPPAPSFTCPAEPAPAASRPAASPSARATAGRPSTVRARSGAVPSRRRALPRRAIPPIRSPPRLYIGGRHVCGEAQRACGDPQHVCGEARHACGDPQHVERSRFAAGLADWERQGERCRRSRGERCAATAAPFARARSSPTCSLRARSRPRHPRRARRTPYRRAPARGSGWLRRSLALRSARWPRPRAGEGQMRAPDGQADARPCHLKR